MKKVELKDAKAEDGSVFSYKAVMLNNLKTTAEGMTIPEMEQSLKIMGQLRSANGSVLLEDADYKYMLDRFDKIRWQVADSVIVQFMKDLKTAPDIDPNQLTNNGYSNQL